MSISRTAGTRALLTTIVAANVLLYASQLLVTAADRNTLARESDYVVRDGEVYGEATSARTRNIGFLSAFVDGVHAHEQTLLIGTSETTLSRNIGCWMNGLHARFPWVTLAKGGLSPIHAGALLARAAAAGISFPPSVYLVNPVYFTDSHDVIDEGWLSQVARTPGILAYDAFQLGPMVTEAFRRRMDTALRHYHHSPLLHQAHLGHLLYLRANLQALDIPPFAAEIDECQDHILPEIVYDDVRNVHIGYNPRDALLPGRWHMHQPGQALNLIGMENILHLWERFEAPLLVILLPPNRPFYAAAGLDMTEFDDAWAANARAIVAMFARETRRERMMLIDASHLPMRHGYRDRMHPDPAGNRKIARFIDAAPAYAEFMTATERYYRTDSARR